jgi:hypothetical protein
MEIKPRFVKTRSYICKCSDIEDIKYNIFSIFNIAKESFKVLMACLLAIFVPQKCGTDVCSIYDNVSNLTDWNKLVLAFNFFTILLMLILYTCDMFREKFLIKYFDKDESKPDNNLLSILNSENDTIKSIRNKLVKYNKICFWVYVLTFTSFIVNTTLSGILIFNDYYLDTRSITVFITNILLLIGKLYNGLSISYNSKKKCLAYSLTLVEPISWNVIDKDIVYSKI